MNPQQQYPPQQGQQPQPYPPQGPPGGYPQQPAPAPGQYQYPPQPGQNSYPQQPSPYQQPLGQPPQPGMPPQTAGYNPYAFTDEYANMPTAKKGPSKVIIITIIILGLLAAGMVAVALLTDDKKKDDTGNATNNQSTTTTDADKDVADRSSGQLNLSSRVSLNKTLKAQNLQAKVKQQVNLSSGFSFMVNKIEDYTSPNPTTKPADGKKFVVVTAVVGNRLDTGNLSVSYLDFRLRDNNNVTIPGHVTTNEILNNKLSSPSELKPGEQLTGKVIFEVGATDTNWIFKHSETYQKTTDDTTFTVEGEIVVSTAVAAAIDETVTSGQTTTTPTPTPATPSTN